MKTNEVCKIAKNTYEEINVYSRLEYSFPLILCSLQQSKYTHKIGRYCW